MKGVLSLKRKKIDKFSYLYLLPAILFLVFVIAGCSQGMGTSPEVIDTPLPTRSWTVLVYMAADNEPDNDLEPFAWIDMLEMETIGSSESMNVLVQFDRSGRFYGNKGGYRYFITQQSHALENSDGTVTTVYTDSAALKAEVEKMTSSVVQELGNTNMGDPNTLIKFVEWGMEKYPANKYAIILWNHGSGWQDDPSQSGRARDGSRGICWDYTSNDYLTEPEVKSALDKLATNYGRKFEFLAMDACDMGQVEVAYDVKDACKWLVSSEATIPSYGFPYNYILSDLKKDPALDGKGLALSCVGRYKQWYQINEGLSSTFKTITISGAKLDQMDNLATSMGAFATAGVDKIDVDGAVMKAARDASTTASFGNGDLKDIKLFMSDVNTNASDAGLKSAALNVNSTLSSTVIYEGHGSDQLSVGGLAVWIPKSTLYNLYITSYRLLPFTQKTGWDKYLDLLVVQ